ncbi:MAG: SRPBCC family protein [Casimicrobium sp.]
MSLVKFNFTVDVNAPRQRVWDVMFHDRSYREWTSAFSPGSYFEGDWSEGSRIRFVGQDENGKLCGLSSRIVANRPLEFIGIEHLSGINAGVEEGPESVWNGAREDYHFSEKSGVTTVRIEQDMVAEYETMFQEMWPNALAKLKALAESKS